MTRSTHVEMMNGSTSRPLDDSVRPRPDQIRSMLHRMDGSSLWSYSVWRAPEGVDLGQGIPPADEYMQCAGSAEALTVEVRFLDADGTARQHVIGKPGRDAARAMTEEIRWDDGRHSTTVRRNEVFTADEAADLLTAYCLTDGVAEPYVLRELDLRWLPPADDDASDRMLVEVERDDAHPGDIGDRTMTVEVPADLMLSSLLTRVIEPFLMDAPRTRWVCRGKSRGRWRDFAEIVTFGPPERLGIDLLIRDHSIRSFVGASDNSLSIICRAILAKHPGDGSGPPQNVANRPLTFGDDPDEEQQWAPGGQSSAQEAFWSFVGERRSDDNLSFFIEDEERGEGLILVLQADTIVRVVTKPEGTDGYRVVTDFGEYVTQVSTFVSGGHAALDRHGPWLPDMTAVVEARLRLAMDESMLRRTHPRELRRRLEILTYVEAREPSTVDGITHFGWGFGNGNAVNAWFAADGRGLVVIFDHTSALASTGDPQANAALYDGVPADLLAMARNVPETDITRSIPHPDGGTLVAATGIFHFSGPCAMADGLVSRLTEEQLGIEDTGLDRLLERFLAMEDFGLEAVARAVGWSPADVAGDRAAVAAFARDHVSTAPLDRAAVDVFRRAWAATGYQDRWGVHLVLFDSCSLEQAGHSRDEVLRAIETLGLELVDSPPEAATGEVWVRTDPRIDLGLDVEVAAEHPVAEEGAGLLELAVRALTFHWSAADLRALRSPPYPLPAQLRPLIGRLEAALPEAGPIATPIGAYVPSSTFHGRRAMARTGLPRVLLDLVTHGILSKDDGERLIEAVESTDLSAEDRELVVRDLRLRLVEASLVADDVLAAERVAAQISDPWPHLGWREIAKRHAARGEAAAFLRSWSHYDASRDRAQMQRLKTSLVRGVAAREGWQAALEACRDQRIGDAFRVHAFEPPAYGYDDLLTLFGRDASGVLAEADELHCLVAAAVAESRPRPVADHRGVEALLTRVAALDPNESREAMQARDQLLSTLRMAVGSDDTLARLRAQIRTPRLRAEAMQLFVGQSDDSRTDGA